MTDNNIGYNVARCDGETFGHTPFQDHAHLPNY